jgi:hypothetical protein
MPPNVLVEDDALMPRLVLPPQLKFPCHHAALHKIRPPSTPCRREMLDIPLPKCQTGKMNKDGLRVLNVTVPENMMPTCIITTNTDAVEEIPKRFVHNVPPMEARLIRFEWPNSLPKGHRNANLRGKSCARCYARWMLNKSKLKLKDYEKDIPPICEEIVAEPPRKKIKLDGDLALLDQALGGGSSSSSSSRSFSYPVKNLSSFDDMDDDAMWG